MRAILAALAVIAVVIAAAVLWFVPLLPNKLACVAAADPIATSESDAPLIHPMDLAWADGFLFVADTENGAVKKFRTDGQFAGEWKGFRRPVDVAASGDSVFVADFITDRITRFDLNGVKLAEFGGHGTEDGAFDAPAGVAVDKNGNLYVTDFYNHRVQKFSSDGEFLLAWGSLGRWNGQFRYPTDVVIDRDGNVLVADAYNHRIQKFAPNGEYLGKWGGVGYGFPGPWPGWFRLAKAMAATPTGEIFVADPFNYRIQKFSADGDLLGIWNGQLGSERIRYPAGVAADDNGLLYVTDFFQNRIRVLRCP